MPMPIAVRRLSSPVLSVRLLARVHGLVLVSTLTTIPGFVRHPKKAVLPMDTTDLGWFSPVLKMRVPVVGACVGENVGAAGRIVGTTVGALDGREVKVRVRRRAGRGRAGGSWWIMVCRRRSGHLGRKRVAVTLAEVGFYSADTVYIQDLNV